MHSGTYLAELVPIVRYLVEFHRYGGCCLRHAARAVGGAEKCSVYTVFLLRHVQWVLHR